MVKYQTEKNIDKGSFTIIRTFEMKNSFFVLEIIQIKDEKGKEVYKKQNFLNLSEYTSKIEELIQSGAKKVA